jgi:HAD superfamily hydrolase (TIGR01509 family)
MIKAIIFDMEGVLINSLEYIWESRNQYFKEKFGFEMTKEEIASMIGMSLEDQLAMIGKKHNVELDYQTCSDEFKVRQFNSMTEHISPNVSARKFIEKALSDGLKIAVCSHNIRENVVKGLKLVHLDDLFKTMITIEDLQEYKPHPSSLLLAANKLNVEPKECLVIEDSPKGITAIKNANMIAVGYKTKYNSKESLLEVGADLVVDKFEDLDLDEFI